MCDGGFGEGELCVVLCCFLRVSDRDKVNSGGRALKGARLRRSEVTRKARRDSVNKPVKVDTYFSKVGLPLSYNLVPER